MKRRRLRLLALPILLISLLLGCASGGKLLRSTFTSEKLTDTEFSGAAGDLQSWTVAIAQARGGPVAGAAAQILLEGQTDPVGYLLPITPPDSSTPLALLCLPGAQAQRCREVPRNALVTVSGVRFGISNLIQWDRLTWKIR